MKETTFHRHVITLIVITPETSPDRLIARLEEAITALPLTHADGTVTAADRAATPYMRVPGPPDRTGIVKTDDDAYDAWRDTCPTLQTWREDGRA